MDRYMILDFFQFHSNLLSFFFGIQKPKSKGLLRQRVSEQDDAVPVRRAGLDLRAAAAHGAGAKGSEALDSGG